MYAIVATGGKQYKVANDDVIEVEKLPAEPGETVELKALALVDGDKVTVDADELAKAKVTGEVLEQFKGEKKIVFKFKRRKGYKRTRGHRQQLTRVKITSVAAN
jgi:large subunit ribosomal protein L21